jgi:hypothetical protein
LISHDYLRRLLATSLIFATIGQPATARTLPLVAQSEQAQEQPPVSLSTVCKKKRSTGGAILGGLAGAAVGAIAGGNLKSAAIGGAAGAGAGYLIGKSWDKKACAESQKAVALAMQTGRTQSWRSDDGSKSYTLSVDRTYTGASTIDRNIATIEGRSLVMTNLADASGVYKVTTEQVNVRDRPDLTKKSVVVDSFKAGDRLLVMGKTLQGDWLLVSSRGVAAEGWIKTNALTATADDPAAFAQSETRPARAVRVAMKPACIETHEVFEVKGSRSNGASSEQCRDSTGVFVSKDAGGSDTKG